MIFFELQEEKKNNEKINNIILHDDVKIIQRQHLKLRHGSIQSSAYCVSFSFFHSYRCAGIIHSVIGVHNSFECVPKGSIVIFMPMIGV